MYLTVSHLYSKVNTSNSNAFECLLMSMKLINVSLWRESHIRYVNLKLTLRNKLFCSYCRFRLLQIILYEYGKMRMQKGAASADILFPFQQYRMHKCFLPFAPAFYRVHIARLVHSIHSPTKRSCSLIRLTGNNRKGNWIIR